MGTKTPTTPKTPSADTGRLRVVTRTDRLDSGGDYFAAGSSKTILVGAGWSSARIGDRLGFNGTTIIATLRKHNVQIRDLKGKTVRAGRGSSATRRLPQLPGWRAPWRPEPGSGGNSPMW
jgi:hypothetical protein